MHLSVRPKRREDFAMNRFLLIAMYGAILAIALTFNFTTCGNGNNMTVRNDSMDENPTRYQI